MRVAALFLLLAQATATYYQLDIFPDNSCNASSKLYSVMVGGTATTGQTQASCTADTTNAGCRLAGSQYTGYNGQYTYQKKGGIFRWDHRTLCSLWPVANRLRTKHFQRMHFLCWGTSGRVPGVHPFL